LVSGRIHRRWKVATTLAAVPELPQGVQHRPQVGLELPRQAPPPSLLRSEDDAVRERRQPLVVVTEVERLALPPFVRRGEGGSTSTIWLYTSGRLFTSQAVRLENRL
jgi:hypothetical protein